jgi:hypothetical protein
LISPGGIENREQGVVDQPRSRKDFFKSLAVAGAALTPATAMFTDRAYAEGQPSTPGVVDAYDYGATPNVDQDSHGAIQAAINAAGIGDVVYLRPGTYSVSQSLTANGKHDITLDFAGVLKPYGSFIGYLVDLYWTSPNPRPATDPTYANYPSIHINKLTLDGAFQCRGLSMHRYDHFLIQRVMCQKMGGTSLRVRNCREADFMNVTAIKSAGGSEPNLYIDDMPIPGGGDGSNNLRFYGLQSVYNTGQALKIEGGGPDNACRNLFFFAPQIHYLDFDMGYGPIDTGVKLIEIVTCQRAHFFGGNLRLGKVSNGTILTVGDPNYAVGCVTLNATNMCADGDTPTALDIVNAKEVYAPGIQWTLMKPATATKYKDPLGAFAEYALKRDSQRITGGTKPGKWFGPPGTVGVAPQTDKTVRATPIFVARTTQVEAMGMVVTTPGSAASGTPVVRLGIYKDDGSGAFPGSLLLDAGTVDVSTKGEKVIGGLNVTLEPGTYWLAAVPQNCARQAPSMRVMTSTLGNIAFSTAASLGVGYSQPFTPGALISPFAMTAASSVNCPRLMLKSA